MKLYACMLVALAWFVSACSSQSTCQQDEPTTNAIIQFPSPIPGSSKMLLVIGPIAPNLSKWGPDDANQPFSWPGRAVQRDQTFPQNPSDQLIYEIRVPENALLQEVRTWIDPADGHTDIPESRAQTMIWTHDTMTAESNLIASSVASSVSISDYEERDCLVMEFPSSMKMESTTRVFVYIFGEWGSGALPGLVVDTPDVVYDGTD